MYSDSFFICMNEKRFLSPQSEPKAISVCAICGRDIYNGPLLQLPNDMPVCRKCLLEFGICDMHHREVLSVGR